MKITKYPQSCLLLEKSNKRILIDPGNFVAEKYKAKDFLPLDGALITHRHADHADPDFIAELASAGVTIIANRDTTELLGETVSEIIDDGGELELGSFKVRAHELAHCLMPDGSEGPQNTGYVVDEIFFHSGDGVQTVGIEVEVSAIPITGPDISMKDVFAFANQIEVSKIIPVHYDKLGAKPEEYSAMAKRFKEPFEFIILRDGESINVDSY